MTNEELLMQMEGVLESGGEAALERYVIDHFEELPKELQGTVLFGFMRETVEGSARITDIQEKGLTALDAIEKMRAELAQGDSK